MRAERGGGEGATAAAVQKTPIQIAIYVFLFSESVLLWSVEGSNYGSMDPPCAQQWIHVANSCSGFAAGCCFRTTRDSVQVP